jgi:hypothetical protein
MSFVSIEEIERLKKDSNMYKSTQRNQLGVSKNVSQDPKKSISSNRMSWIDLFNIGNVMLMRGQDIQVSHQGISPVCEMDDIFAFSEDLEQQEKMNPK